MRFHGIVLLLAVCGFAWPAIGQEKKETPPAGTTQSLADRIKALEEEQKKAEADFRAKYDAAASDEEREKLKPDFPDPAKATPRFRELVKGNEKDPAVPPALAFIIRHELVVDEGMAAIDVLVKHHSKSNDIKSALLALGERGGEAARKAAQAVRRTNPNREMKGIALWSLTTMAMQGAPGEPDKYRKAVVANLDELAKDFADIPLDEKRTLGDVAKAEIAKMERSAGAAEKIAVGKVAPDIAGTDAEGVKFKLSDYRGKVVVVDFWGFW